MQSHGYSTAVEPDDFGMRRADFAYSGKFLRVTSRVSTFVTVAKNAPPSTQGKKQSEISGDLIEEAEESPSPADLTTP